MLEEVLFYLKNWFCVDSRDGTFTVEDGGITLPFLKPGQYYRVIGSLFNDGLHKAGDTDLTEETFDGTIWTLAIPKSLLRIVQEMEAWETKNGAAAASPYQSESFGGYSYSKAANANSGSMVTVWTVFEKRLAPWRKI